MMQLIHLKETKSIPLSIPNGYYVFIEMTTMASYHITVTLKDAVTKKIYFTKERSGQNPEPPISAFYRCDCEQSELYIDIPQSKQIDLRMNNMDICNKDNTLLVRTITAVGEDSTDADYNDFLINLVIMRSNA